MSEIPPTEKSPPCSTIKNEDVFKYAIDWNLDPGEALGSVVREKIAPEILKQTVRFSLIVENYSWKIGLCEAAEGSELVEPESLEMIRSKLLEWFHNSPHAVASLKNQIPRNTIAVIIPTIDFPVNFETTLEDFAYQKLSETLQVTYFNKYGATFLACVSYFPVLNGKEMNIEKDRELLDKAQKLAERHPSFTEDAEQKEEEIHVESGKSPEFPVDPSMSLEDIIENSERPTSLDSSKLLSPRASAENLVEECGKMEITAKVDDSMPTGKGRSYSVTRHQFEPNILKKAEKLEIRIENNLWRVCLALAAEGSELVEPESLEMIRNKFLEWFKSDPETVKSLITSKPLPRNTIAVTFSALDIPNEIVTTDDDFTYQRLSENLQVTYFNADSGNEYITCISYYPVLNGSEMNLKEDKEWLDSVQMLVKAYPSFFNDARQQGKGQVESKEDQEEMSPNPEYHEILVDIPMTPDDMFRFSSIFRNIASFQAFSEIFTLLSSTISEEQAKGENILEHCATKPVKNSNDLELDPEENSATVAKMRVATGSTEAKLGFLKFFQDTLNRDVVGNSPPMVDDIMMEMAELSMESHPLQNKDDVDAPDNRSLLEENDDPVITAYDDEFDAEIIG